MQRQRSRFSRRYVLGGLVAAIATFGTASGASADAPPKAEVMVIHATKCDKKSVDPQIGDAPPALGYDCLKMIDKKFVPLFLNQAAVTALPNGRTFQLLHSANVGPRYRVTASISAADGGPAFTKLAEITADANKPFNVGGFAYKQGVLFVRVKIVP